MSLRWIAREYDYAEDSVVAHLNILKLPENMILMNNKIGSSVKFNKR